MLTETFIHYGWRLTKVVWMSWKVTSLETEDVVFTGTLDECWEWAKAHSLTN